MKKEKLYYRNDVGEFCTAAEWFKENDSKNQRMETDSDFSCAVGKLAKLTEFAPKMKTFCARAILGARKVTEYGGQREFLTLNLEKNGDCTIFYTSGTTGGTREDLLRRIFADIDRLIEKQREFAAAANAQFVEIDI